MIDRLISFLQKNYGYNKEVLVDIIRNANLSLLTSKLLKSIELQQYYASSVLKLQQHIKNEIFLSELRKFIHQCEENNLKPVFLKGLFLAADIYKDIDMRVSSDIDILIQPEDILIYKNILQTNGYYMETNNDICVADKEKLINDLSVMHIVFIKEIGKITVTFELHGSVINPAIVFNNISEDFYNNSCCIQVYGLKVNVLSVEYNFVFLMLHFFKHLPEHYFQNMIFNKKVKINLSNLHDIALLLDKYNDIINWHKIIEISKKMQVVLYINIVSKYVNEIYENIINKDFINLLEDNKELSYMISGYFDGIGLGKFQWLFNQTILEIYKLTITELIAGILPDTINLFDIAYSNNPKNIVYINNSNRYTIRDYAIDINYGLGITKRANISLHTNINKERLNIQLNVYNKNVCSYRGKGYFFDKDSIQIIIIKEKMIIHRMFTLANQGDGTKVILSSYNFNDIVLFEHSEIITLEDGFILKLNIPWDMIGINIENHEIVSLNIAGIISNPSTESFLQGCSLFGNNENAWEFKSIGFMQLNDEF